MARRAAARGGSSEHRHAAILAYDIVGLSRPDLHDAMEHRLIGINRLVAKVLDPFPPDEVIWLKAGDGGYVLFAADAWRSPLFQSLRSLKRWANGESVPLRLALHYGPVRIVTIAGPRGGPQPVGEALNSSASILTRGSSAGIIASAQFRTALGNFPGAEFHDERELRLKHARPQLLYLLSLTNLGARSRWSGAVEEDRHRLCDAVRDGRGFEAILYAKRLLQVNSTDEDATSALRRLKSINFRYLSSLSLEEDINEILGHLSPGDLVEMIKAGQIVDRRYNEVICHRGNAGNTMFVILRGQVGVYSPVDGAEPDPAQPRATEAEGAIIGELAYALSRPRTADLVSLGDTVLLSLEYDEVSKLLPDEGGKRIKEFINGRALEHVSQNVPYLIGGQLGALPAQLQQVWRDQLRILQTNCQIITWPRHKPISWQEIRIDKGYEAADGGICILASGRLRSRSTAGKTLDGEGFPLLYVDLRHRVVAPDHEYIVDEGPAKIIFIGRDAIDRLSAPIHDKLVRELKRAVQSLYYYDVFISYNTADEQIVERWERDLRDLGLRIFRDPMRRGGEEYNQTDGRALLDSLWMLVFVSPHVQAKPISQNWVLKEVARRRKHFGEHARVATVRVSDGDPQGLDIYYSPVAAPADVAALVRAIRGGEEDAPYGDQLRTGTGIA